MKQLKINIPGNEEIVNRKIKEQFTLKNATPYGGYNLFSDYLAINCVDRLLEQELSGMKAPRATYDMPTVPRTLIDGYALGLKNIYQFEGIEDDPLLSANRGMKKLPYQTVLRKDINNQFKTHEDVNGRRRVKGRQVESLLKRLDGNLVLECDSTVNTGYRSQERVEVGTNPHKPGPASYHPQLCRDRKSGLSVWSRLRPRNTVSCTDFVDFFNESWELIFKRFKRKRKRLLKVLSRLDGAYESEEVFSCHEERPVGYLSKMTMRGDFWSKAFCIPQSN